MSSPSTSCYPRRPFERKPDENPARRLRRRRQPVAVRRLRGRLPDVHTDPGVRGWVLRAVHGQPGLRNECAPLLSGPGLRHSPRWRSELRRPWYVLHRRRGGWRNSWWNECRWRSSWRSERGWHGCRWRRWTSRRNGRQRWRLGRRWHGWRPDDPGVRLLWRSRRAAHAGCPARGSATPRDACARPLNHPERSRHSKPATTECGPRVVRRVRWARASESPRYNERKTVAPSSRPCSTW